MYLDELRHTVIRPDSSLRLHLLSPGTYKNSGLYGNLNHVVVVTYFREHLELFCFSNFLHFSSVPEDLVCQVLQDAISSNKTVHTISQKDAGYVKLIAGNPDKEFDGVRFPIFSGKFGMEE